MADNPSDKEVAFRVWLYQLGRDDEEADVINRFVPRPMWLTDQELNCYLSGRTDQRLGVRS